MARSTRTKTTSIAAAVVLAVALFSQLLGGPSARADGPPPLPTPTVDKGVTWCKYC